MAAIRPFFLEFYQMRLGLCEKKSISMRCQEVFILDVWLLHSVVENFHEDRSTRRVQREQPPPLAANVCVSTYPSSHSLKSNKHERRV